MGRYPYSVLTGGYPIQSWLGGGTTIQTWQGEGGYPHPDLGWGCHPCWPGMRCPLFWPGMGVPPVWKDGGTPIENDEGTPLGRIGVSPSWPGILTWNPDPILTPLLGRMGVVPHQPYEVPSGWMDRRLWKHYLLHSFRMRAVIKCMMNRDERNHSPNTCCWLVRVSIVIEMVLLEIFFGIYLGSFMISNQGTLIGGNYFTQNAAVTSLPPAYVVRTTGGYVFTGVCLFNFRGGGVPHLRSGQGGYPIPGLVRGVSHSANGGVPEVPPCPRLDGVPPCPRLDGVPPVQTWDQGVPWVPPSKIG